MNRLRSGYLYTLEYMHQRAAEKVRNLNDFRESMIYFNDIVFN